MREKSIDIIIIKKISNTAYTSGMKNQYKVLKDIDRNCRILEVKDTSIASSFVQKVFIYKKSNGEEETVELFFPLHFTTF